MALLALMRRTSSSMSGSWRQTLAASQAVRSLCAGTSTEELAEFRESVARFAVDVIAPHAEEIDRANNFPAGVDLWREMGGFGLL
jgi:alkylation response protein AidB-like acyl-CoA dehydrogenase